MGQGSLFWPQKEAVSNILLSTILKTTHEMISESSDNFTQKAKMSAFSLAHPKCCWGAGLLVLPATVHQYLTRVASHLLALYYAM